jgi:hypothetical protein
MLRSRSGPAISRGALLSFLIVLACPYLISPVAAKGRKASPAPSSSPTESDLGLKNIPLTVGHEAKGLVLPNYDVNGHLLGRFQAETAARIDEQHVRFTNLKMITYDEKEKPDFDIDMIHAVLNLDTRVIESKERTKVKRADFEIEGDTMRFDTQTHNGTLVGRVHMTVFDNSQLNRRPTP